MSTVESTVATTATPATRTVNSGPSPKDFVKAWETSENLNDFCERTGMAKNAATSRANQYRAKGVKLKVMPRGPRKTKVHTNELNDLIAELHGSKEEGESEEQQS